MIDHQIDALIAQLLPLLRERGLRHTSIFSDDLAPRIYFSHGPYTHQTEGKGATALEALAALDAALGAQRLLETLY